MKISNGTENYRSERRKTLTTGTTERIKRCVCLHVKHLQIIGQLKFVYTLI